jgi:hypothetical protein
MSECVECKKMGRYCEIRNQTLCDVCKKLDKYELLTKTVSKNDYLLNDGDLSKLTSYHATCRHGPVTFYAKRDVINASCDKYGVPEEDIFEEIRNIKHEKNEIRQEKSLTRQTSRKKSLVKALEKAGVAFREDSALSAKYINGCRDLTIAFIVKRMSQMKYLYDYCHMAECRQQAYQEQQEEYEAGYFPDVPLMDAAERIALQLYSNGHYPDVFPWQQ